MIGLSLSTFLIIPIANAEITESETLPIENSKLKLNTNYNFSVICTITTETLNNATLLIYNTDLETVYFNESTDDLVNDDTFYFLVNFTVYGHYNYTWSIYYTDSEENYLYETDTINFIVPEPKDTIWQNIQDFFSSYKVKLIALFIIVISVLILAIVFIKIYKY